MNAAPAVAVLDHGMGNLRSVSKALEVAGARAIVTAERDVIERADVLCVPGQGIFGRCVENMRRGGAAALTKRWIAAGRPFLGICLGLQVLFASSEEDNHAGLGVFEGHVKRLPSSVRVPHIGWNEVEPSEAGTIETGYFYFDHSYAVLPADETIVSGWCDHGWRFAAAIETGSLLGVQFHPEKSGEAGIALLRRWLGKVALIDATRMETGS